MNKVKRAIIMAAGVGTRMRPVTLTTPKPMVKVNGERMIDTVIKALYKNGISEIYVVVGYLKEKFNELKEDFPGITLLENPYYEMCNNISSLYVARNYIENSIILDGDQVIKNDAILFPEFEKSGYNAIWMDSPTTEWVLTVNEGVVTSCSRTGAERGWQLHSVSRWNSEDGKRLKRHLERQFEEKKNYHLYWDDVALFCYPKEYQLGIFEMKMGDIIEIDGIEELVRIDNSYKKYLNGGQ